MQGHTHCHTHHQHRLKECFSMQILFMIFFAGLEFCILIDCFWHKNTVDITDTIRIKRKCPK